MAHLFVINVHDGCYFLVVYLLILVILLNISNISILLNHAKYLCLIISKFRAKFNSAKSDLF